MELLNTTEVREDFAEILNRVAYRKERMIISRRGKRLAAIVPMEDVELLEKLEERMDLESAAKALREPGAVSWKKIKTELNL